MTGAIATSPIATGRQKDVQRPRPAAGQDEVRQHEAVCEHGGDQRRERDAREPERPDERDAEPRFRIASPIAVSGDPAVPAGADRPDHAEAQRRGERQGCGEHRERRHGAAEAVADPRVQEWGAEADQQREQREARRRR